MYTSFENHPDQPPPGSLQEGGDQEKMGVSKPDEGGSQKNKNLWDSLRTFLFVVGSAFVCFVAVRNSITWHVQRFWGASGDYWQRQWIKVYDWFEGDEMNIGVWGTLLVANLVFWFFNAFLLVLDTTGFPQCLLKYKIQEDKKPEFNKLVRAVLWSMFNQTVVAAGMIYASFQVMKRRGCSFGPELPTFHWVVFELVIFTAAEEVFFYYSHRLFHHPRLYKYIHKKHHEWTAPIGVTAVYAHPVEHVISNMLPAVMGPILTGAHIATAWLWISMVLMSTTVAHCGYHFPFLPSPEAHDFHHLKFNNNFGVMGVLDRLHGTDTAFRNSRQYQRHFMLLSLVPLTTQIPDPPAQPQKGKGKPE